MPINQPPIDTENPVRSSWDLEVSYLVNRLEQDLRVIQEGTTTGTVTGQDSTEPYDDTALRDRVTVNETNITNLQATDGFLQTQIDGKQDLIAGAAPTNWNELAREDELMADTSFSIPASDYGTAFVTSSDVFTRTLQYRGEDVVEVRVSSRPIIGIGITNEYTYNYTALNGWNITSVNPAEGTMIEHPGRPETDISIVLQRRRYVTPAELTAVANTAQNNLGDVIQAAIDSTDFADFQRRLGLL